MGVGFIFMSAPPVADQFMGMFGVSYGGLSLFLSAMYWTHSAIQVPAGLFIDRLGIFHSLFVSIALCAVGSLGPLIQPDSLAVAVSFRLILGVSTGMMFLLFIKILTILAPPDQAARAQGMQGAAFCLGTMLPYLTLAHAGRSGWMATYFSGAVFCAILAACMVRLPKAQLEENRAQHKRTAAAHIWQAMNTLATSRRIWFLGCCHGFSFGTLLTIGNWLPTILVDTRTGSTIEDWGTAASVLLLVGTLGRVFSGDAIRLMPRQTLILRAALGIGVLYALLALAGSPALTLAPAMLLALLCGSTYAAILTLTTDTASPAYIATAVGFMNMIANGVNIILILTLGFTRELFGGFGLGLGLAALAAIGLGVWGRSIDWPKSPA